MNEFDFSMIIAGVVAGAAPIVLAAIGETVAEKSGLINLSLDGSILLAAMVSFVAALKTGSLLAGFVAGALVGAAVAAVVAAFSIFLQQHQVAVGFVLTLMIRDMAYFIGNPYSRIQGPNTAPMAIPALDQLPFLGPVPFALCGSRTCLVLCDEQRLVPGSDPGALADEIKTLDAAGEEVSGMG